MTDGKNGQRKAGSRSTVIREVRALGPAVLDQGVWSLAGFVTSALVARFLGAEPLAVFAIGTAIIFGVGGVVNSLILDPAAVIGPRDHDERMRSYGGLVISATAVLGGLAAVIGLGVFVVFSGDWGSMVSMSLLSSLPVLLAWASRRLPYLTGEPGRALLGSFIYLIAVVGGIGIARVTDVLTATVAIGVLGLGGIAQTLVLIPLWRPQFKLVTNRDIVRGVARDHWAFGRWYLAAEAASWMLNYGLAAISAAVIDLASAGAFRASQVLLRPYGIVFVGIGLAFLPRLTRTRRDHGQPAAESSVRRIGWMLSGVGILVFFVLLVAGSDIMRLVFGDDFAEYGWLVATLGGAMILHGWIAAYSMGLQASDRPRDAFFGQAAGAATSLISGIAFGLIWGLPGFAAAYVLASAIRLLTVRTLARRDSVVLES